MFFNYTFGSFDLFFCLFFNYELLVVICFFFFVFFILLSDQGQVSSFFSQLSFDRLSLYSRHLSLRLLLLRDLISFLSSSLILLRKLFFSFHFSSLDLLSSLQLSVKKFSFFVLSSLLLSYFDSLSSRTLFLSFHIKRFLTLFLFSSFKTPFVPVRSLSTKSSKSKSSKTKLTLSRKYRLVL